MNCRIKKLISTFLLFILIFNLGGQLAVHHYLVLKSERFFNKQTSRGLYNVNDLTEVEIPAYLPGLADQQEYIDTYGEVRFADASYNYVKMKLTRNAIFLLCVPNYATTRPCGMNIIHAENIKHIPVSKKEHVPFGKSTIASFFNFAFQNVQLSVPVKSVPALVTENDGRQVDCSLEIPQPPPKSFSSLS